MSLVQAQSNSSFIPMLMLYLVFFLTFLIRVTSICRLRLDEHYDADAYKCLNIFTQGRRLIKILVDLLQCKNDELRISSARLLFDLHKREHILFNDAIDSYLVTATSSELFTGMVVYGAFSDDDQLLLKLHQGKLEDLTDELLTVMDEFAEVCVLEGDPSEPNVCNQGIAYSTSKCLVYSGHHVLKCMVKL